MTIQPIELAVELYLAPEATGVYDWVSITPLAGRECTIDRGVDDMNDEPTPGWMRCSVRDADGNLNPRNPLGTYFGHIGIGTQMRAAFRSTEDSFGRTQTNTWGSVGNASGDTWTNGSSSGGTVSATDWTVSGGTARHSVPATSAYRVSELSKTARVMADSEVRFTVTCPTSNVTGTGAIATEVWFRTENVLNYVGAALAFLPDDTLSVAFYDRTAGVNRYLMNYTTIPGLTLGGGTVYNVAFQIDGATLRAKVWESGDPEPMDWQASASGADVRTGYIAVASFVYSGNTNTLPLVFQYDNFKLRLPAFAGELTGLNPEGDDASSGAKAMQLTAHDIINRVNVPDASDQSMMRRGRATARRWLFVQTSQASGGSTSTVVLQNGGQVGDLKVGDIFFLSVDGVHKEDTPFRVISSAVDTPLGFTTFTFSPDARDSVAHLDKLFVVRESLPTVQPIAYWPMEDGDDSTQISSGLESGSPMSIAGTVDFGSYSDFPVSKPVIQMNDAELNAKLPFYDSSLTNAMTITFLLGMPSSDEGATGSDLLQWYMTGTGYSWDLRYAAAGNGSFQLLVFSAAGTLLYDTGTIDFGLRGVPCLATISLDNPTGTQVRYRLYTTTMTGGVGGTGPTNVTGVTSLGRATQIRVNPAGGYDAVGMGHLVVVPGLWTYLNTYLDVVGWKDVPAMQRLLRVGYEENIPLAYRGHPDVLTTKLGRQKVDTVFGLLKDIPRSDGGFLSGAKGAVALEYCTRGFLHNQDPVFTLHGGAGGHIARPFEPVFDNSGVYNYVTVDRADGATVIAEQTEGHLSTELPPAGISRRERTFTLSLGSDIDAQTAADWRLALGTVDRPRIAEVSASPAARNSVTLEQLADMNIGRRIDIDTLESRDIYGTLNQIVAGYALDLKDRFDPRVTINTVPYDTYVAFALTGDDSARADAADSVIAGAAGAIMLAAGVTGAGVLTVRSTSEEYLWTTTAAYPGDFPLNIEINGEVMTVSEIAGESPLGQSFNISARAVNGVSKSHRAGSEVHIAQQNHWAMR